MLQVPFVVIVGTRSSGTSATAGVAYHLGVWMGKSLGGPYGFEDRYIEQIMRRHKVDPRATGQAGANGALKRDLTCRVRGLRRAAMLHDTIAGAKLPRLSVAGVLLREICGPYLRVIACERPFGNSMASVRKRTPKWAARIGLEWQRGLYRHRERLVTSLPPASALRVHYDRLIDDTGAEVRRIADFLELTPSEAQIAKAIGSVRPEMRHIAP